MCVCRSSWYVLPPPLLLQSPIHPHLLNQEGGRSKSHRYWPKLGSKHNSATHGKFKVTTKFRTDSGCYATTGLKVKHLLSGQERTVWHLQYTDWPEQGCPEYVQGFLCECVIIISLCEFHDITGSDETIAMISLFCI